MVVIELGNSMLSQDFKNPKYYLKEKDYTTGHIYIIFVGII